MQLYRLSWFCLELKVNHRILLFIGGKLVSSKSKKQTLLFIGGNLVSSKTKKQTVVSRSSAGSKYHAMAHTTCELLWLKSILVEFEFQHK